MTLDTQDKPKQSRRLAQAQGIAAGDGADDEEDDDLAGLMDDTLLE